MADSTNLDITQEDMLKAAARGSSPEKKLTKADILPSLRHLQYQGDEGPKLNIQMGFLEDTLMNPLAERLPFLNQKQALGVSVQLLEDLDTRNHTHNSFSKKSIARRKSYVPPNNANRRSDRQRGGKYLPSGPPHNSLFMSTFMSP